MLHLHFDKQHYLVPQFQNMFVNSHSYHHEIHLYRNISNYQQILKAYLHFDRLFRELQLCM
jgi:hypothetical protein